MPLRQQQLLLRQHQARRKQNHRAVQPPPGKGGYHAGQYALLANIERNPGISVSALAETMDLERTTLVRNLKPLEARGLIVDAACKGRSRSLQLSVEGKETFARARIYWQQAQDELEAFLGQEQIAELNHLISAILELN